MVRKAFSRNSDPDPELSGTDRRNPDPDGCKNKKGLRYLTLSSKGLPEGVTGGISRTHFAVGSERITKDIAVFLTEGPLKGDTTLDLLHRMGKTGTFICIQGVNSTKELPEIAGKLLSCGCTQVFDALDMDKLTNVHVHHSLDKIAEILGEKGVKITSLFWDRHYASYRRFLLEEKMREHHLALPESENDFEAISRMTEILHQRGIDTDHYPVGAEETVLEEPHWMDATKGIDDYLLSVFQSQ